MFAKPIARAEAHRLPTDSQGKGEREEKRRRKKGRKERGGGLKKWERQ